MSVLVPLLLVSVTLLVPATLLVFTVSATPGRPLSPVGAVLAAVVVALGGLAAAAAYGATPVTAVVVAVILALAVGVWAPVARPWAARGLVAWGLTVATGVAYLAYVLTWTLGAGLSAAGVVASLVLWTLELFIFVIGVGYVWEFVDVLTRRRWTGAVDPAIVAGARRPFVSLHVPTHNEPPDMVIETLEALLRLDYEDYEILLVDNNTTDPALWRPVEEFCARHDRIVFLHLEDWPGYKSGALNHALTRTDPRAELIGIIDADYLVDPDFLSSCAPLFEDDGVVFVQTPQDYRGWEHAAYFRRLYHSYGYFFDVSQRSRNERNGAIFGGTMGLIRTKALMAVGGWDEWCITEDAELSLRLLRAGGRGLHVQKSYGRGVMPLTFEALKRQRFRWCFGGVQILRMHWRSLLPGRRTETNRLTAAQRWAYLVGGLQWFGDLAGALFTGFLLIGALDAVLGSGLVVRRLSGLILLSVLVVLVLGMVRALTLVRRTSGATWRDAVGAFGLWMALGLTVAQASARGLVAREGAFLRTPKVRGELGWRDAVRGNPWEIGLTALCAGVGAAVLATTTVGGLAVGSLLLLQGAGYALAPINSVAAIRSDLPADLRRRRREWRPSWERLARPARRGGVVLVVAAASAVALVALAAPLGAPDLTELPAQVREESGQPGVREKPARTPSPTSTVRPGGPTSSSTGLPMTLTTGPGSTAPGSAGPVTQPTQATQPTQTPTGQPSQATQPTQAPSAQPTQPPASQATQAPTTSKPSQATPPPVGGGSANAPTSRPTGRP